MNVADLEKKWGPEIGLTGNFERREAVTECPGMMLAILVVKDKLSEDLKESLQEFLERDELSVMLEETARGFIEDLGDDIAPPFIAIVSPGTRKVINKIKFREV